MAAPVFKTSPRKFFAYVSDDGTTYNIATTKDNGDAQSATPVAARANPSLRKGYVPRRVFGKYVDSGTVYRTYVPVLSASGSLWDSGTTTFTKAGVSWDIQGRIGERQTVKGA